MKQIIFISILAFCLGVVLAVFIPKEEPVAVEEPKVEEPVLETVGEMKPVTDRPRSR